MSGTTDADTSDEASVDKSGEVDADTSTDEGVDTSSAGGEDSSGAEDVDTSGDDGEDMTGVVEVDKSSGAGVDTSSAEDVDTSGAEGVDTGGANGVEISGAAGVDTRGAEGVDTSSAAEGDTSGVKGVDMDSDAGVDMSSALAVGSSSDASTEMRGVATASKSAKDTAPHANGADTATPLVEDEGAQSIMLARAGTETPAATGKRTTPPTPTSSDDEDERITKWAYTTPEDPFPATFSPIEVAESLTKIIADAVARSKETVTEDPGHGSSRAERRHKKKAAAPPRRRQLALSEFYAPESLAEAQARLEQEINARVPGAVDHWIAVFPSPELDALLNDVRSPGSTAAWCAALQARVIKVPGNGGCLYYTLHCCRTGQKLVGLSITVQSYHSVEANYYKAKVNKTLLEYLNQMISDGTVTLTELRQRYFGIDKPCTKLTERRKTTKAIRAFIDDVKNVNLAAKGLERSQWAGDAELFATVWFLRELVFVLYQLSETSSTVRVLWLERTDPTGPERIVQLFPEAGEAYEFLRSFLRQRVLPTVVVHTTADGGHYNALRFNEDFYKEWTADDRTGAAMRRRMDPVLAKLGWYVAPLQATGIPTTTIVHVDSSGSEYEPSHPSILSPAVFQLSPDAPLPPPAHYGLLSALNPKGRRRSVLAALWDQAEQLNFQAYRTWDEMQPSQGPRTEPDSVEAGCIYWSASIPQLVALLRALPYPEVAMSLMRPDILVRLGNELNDLSAHGTVADFVRAEDPVEARRQWARLVALVVVVSNDDLIDPRSVEWLRQHPRATTDALHDLRLHNWTVVSTR